MLQISSESLLEWGGWKSGAKQYLQTMEVVDIGELVDEYSILAKDY